MSTIKSEFRKQCKALRQNYLIKSSCEKAFINSSFYDESDTLLIYASFGSEADTFGLINHAICDNKIVFLPKVIGDEMKFLRVYDTNSLVKGTFGVSEPSEGAEYAGQKAVCIVPGLAFDKKGNRLGYGKGYYDKFLSKYSDITKIGFCSGCCFFESVPYEATDVKMDIIFVDDTLFGIKGGF